MVVAMKSELREKKELSEKERLFIENQNHCALCNSELLINVARLTLPAYWLKKPTAAMQNQNSR